MTSKGSASTKAELELQMDTNSEEARATENQTMLPTALCEATSGLESLMTSALVACAGAAALAAHELRGF